MNWKIVSAVLLSASLLVASIGLLRYERRLKINQFPSEQTEILRKAIRIDPFLSYTLYQMMKDTHEVFEKAQIPYWIDGGTLLGASRHKGIIPWDDDLDIGISLAHKDSLDQLGEVFHALGYKYTCYPTESAYKISPLLSVPCQSEDGYYPALDIFLFHSDPSTRNYIQTSEAARKLWPKAWYSAQSIEKLSLVPFGSFLVYSPSHATEYLSRFYGEDWNTLGVFTHRHMTNFLPPKFQWTLTSDDLLPAQPSHASTNNVKNHPEIDSILSKLNISSK